MTLDKSHILYACFFVANRYEYVLGIPVLSRFGRMAFFEGYARPILVCPRMLLFKKSTQKVAQSRNTKNTKLGFD